VADWTAKQSEAIEARGEGILVSASAGAGKTSVLAERVLSYLVQDPPVDVDRLLIVTFTDGAAAEMRTRIGRALESELKRRPSEQLRRQLVLLNNADICTIHSFCLRVVRRYFHHVGLDPDFRVMDGGEAELLKLDVITDLFDELYERDAEGGFLRLVDRFGRRGDDRLRDVVLDLYAFARSTPWPEYWLKSAAAAFSIPEGEGLSGTVWFAEALRDIERGLRQSRDLLMQALRLTRLPAGPAGYVSNLETEIEAVSRGLAILKDAGDWDQISEAVSAAGVFPRLKGGSKDDDPRLQSQVKDLRNRAKEIVRNIGSTYLALDGREHLQYLRAAGEQMQELTDLVCSFAGAFAAEKKRRGLLDFSDLEHYCLQVLYQRATPPDLVPSAVASEVRRKYYEILIDEYQDVNQVQEAIFDALTGDMSSGPCRFMVGDVKQSIYRFRLAEPALFMEKYEQSKTLKDDCRVAAGDGRGASGYRRIDLTRNFRSRTNIIACVNFLFHQLMSRELGEVDYDEAASLTAGAEYPPLPDSADKSIPVELHLVERATEYRPGDEVAPEVEIIESMEILQKESLVVAARIEELVKTGTRVWDKEKECYRPVSYGDIAVLMRATSGRVNAVVDVLQSKGIPAYSDLDTGYFDTAEISTMLSLLKVIDNPRQDIPLVGVLRSPIGGFDAAELGRIRLCDREGDFYDALTAGAGEEGLLGERIREFLTKLADWRDIARRQPLSELIWAIYRQTDYLYYAGGLPGGRQRQANLRSLYERAREFDSFSSRQGLFDFLRFVDRLREKGEDLGPCSTAAGMDGAVRVMSIHKSKGLEFPFVFVVDLGKRFNKKDLTGDLLYHRHLGLGPKYIDLDRRVKFPTLAYRALKARLDMESLSEEMRVLYVAMTRARERLIMVGSASELERKFMNWGQAVYITDQQLPVHYLTSAGTYLDWICSALARHPDGEVVRSGSRADPHGSPRMKSEHPTCPHPDPHMLPGNGSKWNIKIWKQPDLVNLIAEASSETHATTLLDRLRRLEPTGRPSDERRRGFFSRCTDWQYPRQDLTGLAAKLSVTELKRRYTRGSEDGARRYPITDGLGKQPRFVSRDRMKAAELGSAVHLFMQHVDLHACQDLEQQVARLVEKEILSPDEADAIDLDMVRRFLEHPLGKSLVAYADRVEREVPFMLRLPASEVYTEVDTDEENVIIQGVIDCVLWTDRGLVIIDFKTNRCSRQKAQELACEYALQLRLYARAMREIYGREIAAAYLYFLFPGIAVPVTVSPRLTPREYAGRSRLGLI